MGAVSHELECFLGHLPILEHQPLRAVQTRSKHLDSHNHPTIPRIYPWNHQSKI